MSRTILFPIIALAIAAGLWWFSTHAAPDAEAPSPVVANIDCAAASVVLDQHLFAVGEAGETVAPDITTRAAAYSKKAQAYIRGLRRRDDPHVSQIRSIIAMAELARDAAVADDSPGFIADTLARLETCAPTLSGVSSE